MRSPSAPRQFKESNVPCFLPTRTLSTTFPFNSGIGNNFITHHWFVALKQVDLGPDDAQALKTKLVPMPLLKGKVVERILVETNVEAGSKHGTFDSLNCLGAEGDLTHQGLNKIVLKTGIHIIDLDLVE